MENSERGDPCGFWTFAFLLDSVIPNTPGHGLAIPYSSQHVDMYTTVYCINGWRYENRTGYILII